MSRMIKIARTVERRPHLVLACVFLVSVFMAYGVTRLSMTTDFSKFIPEEHPAIKAKLAFESEFGQVSYAPILIEGDNLTRAEAIHGILELKNSLLSDQELENFVTQVEAYTDYVIPPIMEMSGGVFPPDPQLEISVQLLLARPGIAERVVGKLITADQRAALVNISIRGELSEDERVRIISALREHVDNFNASNENLLARVTGDIIIHEDIYRMMNRDNGILIPAAVLLVAVILFLIFKRISDILIALLIIGLGSMWAVGTMGYLGLDFTMFHVALVPLLLGLGIDYSISLF